MTWACTRSRSISASRSEGTAGRLWLRSSSPPRVSASTSGVLGRGSLRSTAWPPMHPTPCPRTSISPCRRAPQRAARARTAIEEDDWSTDPPVATRGRDGHHRKSFGIPQPIAPADGDARPYSCTTFPKRQCPNLSKRETLEFYSANGRHERQKPFSGTKRASFDSPVTRLPEFSVYDPSAHGRDGRTRDRLRILLLVELVHGGVHRLLGLLVCCGAWWCGLGVRYVRLLPVSIGASYGEWVCARRYLRAGHSDGSPRRPHVKTQNTGFSSTRRVARQIAGAEAALMQRWRRTRENDRDYPNSGALFRNDKKNEPRDRVYR